MNYINIIIILIQTSDNGFNMSKDTNLQDTQLQQFLCNKLSCTNLLVALSLKLWPAHMITVGEGNVLVPAGTTKCQNGNDY